MLRTGEYQSREYFSLRIARCLGRVPIRLRRECKLNCDKYGVSHLGVLVVAVTLPQQMRLIQTQSQLWFSHKAFLSAARTPHSLIRGQRAPEVCKIPRVSAALPPADNVGICLSKYQGPCFLSCRGLVGAAAANMQRKDRPQWAAGVHAA